jgi:hypothetical protein
MGLELSDEKTKLTHWSNSIMFLGYQIQGKQRAKGIGIRAVLSIPKEKSKCEGKHRKDRKLLSYTRNRCHDTNQCHL